MRCPFCENEDTKVIDSRHTEEGHAIRRRRECEKCGKRFTTYEKIEEMVLVVIKKDEAGRLSTAARYSTASSKPVKKGRYPWLKWSG